jgi:hypothetical protein
LATLGALHHPPTTHSAALHDAIVTALMAVLLAAIAGADAFEGAL